MSTKGNDKYVGLVKWFHDQVRDANYGFIQHAKLGDLFFHESSIERGQDIESFRENAIVVFIAKKSKKYEDKLEAVNVKFLDNETDLNFLFGHFLSILTEKGKYSDYITIQKGVHSKITSLLENSNDKIVTEQLFERFQNYVNEQIQSRFITDEVYLKGILKVAKGFFPDNYKQIADTIEKNIPIELAHKLWLEGYVETCQINHVAKIIFSETEQTKQKIYNRCSENDLNQLFEPFKNHIIEKIDTNTSNKEFEVILNISKELFPANHDQITNIVEKNITEELAHKLWLDGFIEVCQIDYIASTLLSETEQTQRKILKKCSEKDKKNIFSKALYNIDKIDTEAKFNSVKQLLNLSKAFALEQHEKILSETIKSCNDYFQLSLWLEGYHEILDFHAYKIYIITLSPDNQKKFVKKVLKYIHEEKANISVEDLTSLNVLDYETSKLAEPKDNSKLDYSTSIILNVISELNNQTKLKTKKDKKSAKHRIYDLIIKQIRQPKDILEISGFFDECEGRCSVSVQEEKNESGEVVGRNVEYSRNEFKKAKNHPICDGRKAVDNITGKPVLSEENVEFWWCANQKCFKPSRGLHSPEYWEKYTLLDFLTILKVDFKESDLEIYLNIINTANRFLKHLNCRECNSILYPKGRANYAFYGVTKFVCNTEDCSEKGKEIYLSHCLNGYCEMEIDSRDSVKCKPEGFESCGWYVCNYCHSCCSSEQLQRRKWVYDNIMKTEYKCHLKGHKDLGVISCNNCGEPMEANATNIEEYNRILNWLVSNKDTSNYIHKSGRNRRGKWWFTIRRENYTMEEFRKKLTTCLLLGFQIPDFDKDKNLQLIAEPIDFQKHDKDILICKSCGNILDLSSEPEKANAVKKFHKVRFDELTKFIK